MPALVDVLTQRVRRRIGVIGCRHAIPADPQHVESKRLVDELADQLDELALATGVGPGAEGGPIQRGAGVGLGQFVGVAIHTDFALEATTFFTTGVELTHANLHDLALDLVHVQAGDEAKELDGGEQGRSQGGFHRAGDTELLVQLADVDAVGFGQGIAVFVQALFGLNGQGLAH
ncbi:hypothetical protein D3C71_1514510 [compost metagenome]